MLHKQKGSIWTDHKGRTVPSERITKTEKFQESKSYAIGREAQSLQKRLTLLKAMVEAESKKVKKMISGEIPQEEFSITWYNFDKSIKIIFERRKVLETDNETTHKAYALFVKLMEKNLENQTLLNFIKSVFHKKGDHFDQVKLSSFQKLRQDEVYANDVDFCQAMELLNKATTVVGYKSYDSILFQDPENPEVYLPLRLNYAAQSDITYINPPPRTIGPDGPHPGDIIDGINDMDILEVKTNEDAQQELALEDDNVPGHEYPKNDQIEDEVKKLGLESDAEFFGIPGESPSDENESIDIQTT